MADCFGISVKKYYLEGGKQLEALGKTLKEKCKTKWASPVRENVHKLGDISDNIPPIIRKHHQKGDGLFRIHGNWRRFRRCEMGVANVRPEANPRRST